MPQELATVPLGTLWADQEELLRALATQVHSLAAGGELWLPEENILNSLAHIHVNRLLGLDQEQEMAVYAFWRRTLEIVQGAVVIAALVLSSLQQSLQSLLQLRLANHVSILIIE